MQVNRCRQTQGLLQQDLARRVVCQVLAAHDMRDALVSIVNHHGQLVSPQAVAALEHKVTYSVGYVLILLTQQAVLPMHFALRHPQTQRHARFE